MTKLSNKERQLLGLLELNADLSAADLAKRIRSTPAMVRYYVRKLLGDGVLSPRQPIIDVHSLGLTYYTVYLTLSANSKNEITALIKYLMTAPKITWIYEIAGDYHLAFSVCGGAPHDLANSIKDLESRFPNIIFDKAITTQTSFIYTGRRYLTKTQLKNSSLPRFTVKAASHRIDSDDQIILSAMTNNAASNVLQISKATGLSASSVTRKIKALEDSGVILGYFHWIDPKHIGRRCFIIRIQAHGFSSKIFKALETFAIDTPQVIFVSACFGAWDYEVGVEIEADEELITLTQALHEHCGDLIYPTRSMPILRYRKLRAFPLKI